MLMFSFLNAPWTLSFFVLIFLSIYLWFRKKFTYWSKRGVVGPEPKFPFGNIEGVIKRKVQFFQPYCDNYFKYKDRPFVGLYCFHRPVLSINDPEVMKLILITYFDHFQSHGIFSGGVGDPLAGHLFNIWGAPWKALRRKMTPAFAPGKLKAMFPFVERIASEAEKYARWLHSRCGYINASELNEKYSMEIIASVGFGVEFNGFKNPQSEFFVRGHEYFFPRSAYWHFVRALAFFAPEFFNKLKIRRVSADIINFFHSLVQDTVRYRKANNYKRNDFLQALIELKNYEEVPDKETEKESEPFRLSMVDVAANTMLYMFAGYETSATTSTFAVLELASQPSVQNKARREVLATLARHDGECTYEALNEMQYLNMVLDETMRKYPPMRALFRRCTKQLILPGHDLVIEEGTQVFIPIQGVQMDPNIFPDPERFDPDRFSPEKKGNMHPCHWMPFGEGPRKCLGLRQGYIQSKTILVKLLQKYELILDERTTIPVKVKPDALPYAAEGGVWIRLRRLEPFELVI